MSDRDTKAKEYDAVVSGLRDEPCAFKRQCFRDGWDAAIAALPDMVRPLVWYDYGTVEAPTSMGSVVEQNGGFYRIRQVSLGTWIIEGDLNGEHPTLEAAKAAAQAHHTAAIVSAFGVQGGEA